MTNIKRNNYRKALVEVEAVLNCLNYEDYKKIPQNIMEAIEINKDEDYIYKYDEDLDYKDWDLIPEAKAILYNIFKQYLATEEQREYFKQKELLERERIEEKKKQKYNANNLFVGKNLNENQIKSIKVNNEMIEYKKTLFEKIISGIKNMFGNKK